MYQRVALMAFLCLSVTLYAHAGAPDHLVISEVQIAGETTKDEFVELLNPTSSPVSVAGWKLTKKTSSGTESNLLSSSSFPDVVIGAYSYYLIAHPNYQGLITPDAFYSATTNSVADNSTILLYDNTDIVVDKVGMGTAADFEGAATISPDAGKSIARKDVVLGSGVQGPAQDTDNNSEDFVLQDTPNPQNSDVALPVTLLASQVYWSTGSIVVTWECVDEQVLHWHVLRADDASSEFARVTPEPIRTSEDGKYKYVDDTVEADRFYLYVLEAFDRTGVSSRLPVVASTTSVMHGSRLTTLWGSLKRR